MAEYFKGTVVASPLVNSSSGDTYGTHHSVLGVGGYLEVKTLAERNAIPPTLASSATTTINFDGISAGRRRLGMLVHVYEDNVIYHLQPNLTLTAWNLLSDSSKVSTLANNSNWNVFLTSGGTTTVGENISKNFYQSTHGFTGGTVIGFNGSIYTKVNSSTASTIEPLGIVSQKIDADNFKLTYAGYINTTGFKDYTGGTLVAGTVYYLATGTSANNLTKYPPTSISAISKPMLVALPSGNTGVVLQYRGSSKNDVGVSYGVFTGYTATTKIALDKTVTGATNIGYFSGMTGIQYLDVLTSYAAYNGFYSSLPNNYYRDITGKIQLGTPTYNGALRRGYVKSVAPVKSFLYNMYTGSTNKVGWILVDGDISTSVGTQLTALADSGTPPFTVTGWTTGYHSTSGFSLTASGSLTTGTTYNIGGPIYNNKTYQELRLRTLMSNNDDTIKISYDDNFIYVSGATGGVSSGINVGTGEDVYHGKNGTTLQFNSIIGSGSTSVTKINNDTLVIYSSGGSGGGGTYNLSSPTTLTVGGICQGTIICGKTAFELFEELLVPELCGTIVPPSLTVSVLASGLYEIGCTLLQTVSGTFSRGSITPQYCSVSPFRSGCVNAYCFSGCGMTSGFQACNASSANQSNPTYVVCSGTQSWGMSARYNCGYPALGSKSTQYCAALPTGCTTPTTCSIVGTYPIFATCYTITPPLSKLSILYDMSTANCVAINLVSDVSPNKQSFEVPCAWITSRPLCGVQQWNTVSSQWEYPGGCSACSLVLWSSSGSTESVQGNSINYRRYTYNGVDRSSICIRLVF